MCAYLGASSPSTDNDYDIICSVGCGGYGFVFKAFSHKSGDIVALKRVKTFDPHVGLPISFYKELNAISKIHHKNIVGFREVFRSKKDDCIYIVMDYCEYDLSALIHNIKLSYQQKKSYMKQILEGISEIHKKNVIHRDLKPSNILVQKDNVIKIADFGLSKKIEKSMPLTNKVTTLSYRAPEVLLGDVYYGKAVDIWSLGCLFYEMLAGKALFRHANCDLNQLIEIFKVCGSPNHENWPGFDQLPNAMMLQSLNTFESTLKDLLIQTIPATLHNCIWLIESMLQLDPKKRITVDSALNSGLFNDNFALSYLEFPDNHAIDVNSIPIANIAPRVNHVFHPNTVYPPSLLA